MSARDGSTWWRWRYALLPGAIIGAAGLVWLSGSPDHSGAGSVVVSGTGVTTQAALVQFEPPAENTMSDNEMGQQALQGRRIFTETQRYAPQFVGNGLNCSNCHLDAGRKADSAPMWAAYVSYPAFRLKNQHVNSLYERIQGCFSYSMNGKAPPLGDPVLLALESYFRWLATGAPVGGNLAGAGYPRLAKPQQAPDYRRGEQVYAQNCAVCHGIDGGGQRSDGQWAFPALWGKDSYNWGAGMHKISTAAAFIQANMPLSRGGLLDTQQAWDVALFINSHDRPQDPRFAGSVKATRAQFHDSHDSMYGRSVEGKLLDGLGGTAPM